MAFASLQEKWAPVLNHDSLPEIKDTYKKGVVAQLLENQERAIAEEGKILSKPQATLVVTPLVVPLLVSIPY